MLTSPLSLPDDEPADDAGSVFAVALYDFKGEEPGDLSFKKGDRIQLSTWNDTWWAGSIVLGSSVGSSGMFPRNHVALAD